MIVLTLLILSVSLQCIAAYLALRLAYLTSWRMAWLFIAGAVVLMAVRRSVTLIGVLSGGLPQPSDVLAEWVSLIISLLLVAGLARFGPLFVAGQRAKEETAALLARNQALVWALAEIVYDWRPQTDELQWGGEYTRILGYTAEEMGRDTASWTSRVHPDDLPGVRGEVEAAKSEERCYEKEYRFRRRDGTYAWMYDRGVLTLDTGGNLERIVGVFRDITEHKRAEEALRESEERYRNVVELSPEAIFVNHDGRIAFANSACVTLLGAHTAGQLVGKSPFEIVRPDDHEEVRGLIKGLLERGGSMSLTERKWVRLDGTLVDVEVTASALPFEGGTAIQVLARNITERKRAEEALRTSEERFRASFKKAAVGMGLVDPSGRFVETNQALSDITGYSEEELKTLTFADITHPDDRAENRAVYQKMIEGKREGFVIEKRYRRKDGTTVWVTVSVGAIFDRQGNVTHTIGLIEDITERKRAEEALRASEERLRQTIRVSDIGIFDHDHRADTIYWSPMQRNIFGWGPDEPVTLPGFLACVYEEDLERIQEAVRRAHDPAGDGLYDVEHRIVRRDSAVRWISTRSQTFFEGEGGARRPVRTVGANIDITERKRVEEVGRESESFISSMLEHLPNMVFVKDAKDLRFVRINKAGEELLGYPREVLLGKNDYDFFPKEQADSFTTKDRNVLQSGRLANIPEEPIRTKNEGLRILHTKKIPIADETGAPRYLLGISEDITERKRAEEALRESQRLLEKTFTSLNDAILIVDADTRIITACNAAVHPVLGYTEEEMIGRNTEFLHPTKERYLQFGELFRSQLDASGIFKAEYQLRRKDGRIIDSEHVVTEIRDDSGRRVSLVSVVRDITERKRAEEALREHAERLQLLSGQLVEAQEAEGRRIGRELHDDLGQILTSLKIYLQTLPGRSGSSSFSKKKADSLALIDQAVERIRNLSADLHPTVLDDLGLAAALRWLLDRQARQAGFKIRFISRGMEERLPPEIEATCFRIAQEALTNVVRHAHARNVRIELSRQQDELHLLVADDGIGFDPESVRAESIRGKSLGLIGMEERALLVKGRLDIRSARDKGTELHVRIPLSQTRAQVPGAERSRPT